MKRWADRGLAACVVMASGPCGGGLAELEGREVVDRSFWAIPFIRSLLRCASPIPCVISAKVELRTHADAFFAASSARSPIFGRSGIGLPYSGGARAARVDIGWIGLLKRIDERHPAAAAAVVAEDPLPWRSDQWRCR
jgi:hypothetical protein